MLSYNQIIGINREFANKHFVLKNFGNGQAWKITQHNQKGAFKYPIMWMEDLPSSSPNKIFALTFRVHFLGKVSDLKKREDDLMTTNENEVKSDMIQCAQDLISFWVQDTIYPALTIGRNFNITTLENELDDDVTGCYVDITFSQSNSYNSCIIPMSDIPTPPSVVCKPVIIKVNGEDYDTVPSGGEKDILVQYENGTPTGINVDGVIEIPNPITCADSTITVNGDEFATVVSGGTLPITVEYETSGDNPIQSVIGNNIIIVDPVVIPTTRIYRKDIYSGAKTSYHVGDTYWRKVNEIGKLVQPELGVMMRLQFGSQHLLEYPNIFDSLWRWTGLSGGYFDPETGLYYNKLGAEVTREEAFPSLIAVDHLTSDLRDLEATGAFVTNWMGQIDFGLTRTTEGFTGWYLPSVNEIVSIGNWGVVFGYRDQNPPFNLGTSLKILGDTYMGGTTQCMASQTYNQITSTNKVNNNSATFIKPININTDIVI